MYAHARPAIHSETDGSLEPSVSAPTILYRFQIFPLWRQFSKTFVFTFSVKVIIVFDRFREDAR